MNKFLLQLTVIFSVFLCSHVCVAANKNCIVEISYTDFDRLTPFAIIPELYDTGKCLAVDTLTVQNISDIDRLIHAIWFLQPSIQKHIDVRACMTFYYNNKVTKKCYISMFCVYYDGRMYEVNDNFKIAFNEIIKKYNKNKKRVIF